MLLAAAQVLCGSALGFTLVTLFSLWRWRRAPRPPAPAEWPPIALLRPCEGPDPHLLENLLSSGRAHYPGPRRVLFLVPDAGDPAHPIAVQAAQALAAAAVPAEVVVTRIGEAGNRKVAQLAAGAALAREDLLVQADSDVHLLGDNLPELVAALLADERCGAAFAAPIETRPVTGADRASSALVGASQQSFLGLYALSRTLGGVPSLAGALCAFRRGALAAVGGFGALAGLLGEDYEIARRLQEAGLRVALTPAPARCTDGGRGLREVTGRVRRWMMVVRAQRPGLLWGYPFFLAATPLHLVTGLVLCALGGGPTLLCMAGALWLSRAVLAAVLRRLSGGPRGPGAVLAGLRDVLAAEGLMWLGLVGSLSSRRVVWRGHRYRVERGGRLVSESG